MHQYVLANLLANNDDALGVLFLDGSGETRVATRGQLDSPWGLALTVDDHVL